MIGFTSAHNKRSTRVAAYIRVSTAEAATHGHSLDAQREAIARYARQRGWELVKIYEDAGISGTRSDRPALQRLLRDAEQAHFEVVIVHAIDRFYRNLQGLLKALNHLYQHDVAFISIVENIDFTTPWGKLALAVLGTLAEIYIDTLSAETKKGKRARAMKGLYNGSVPLGYCRGNCSTCTDPNGKGYCPRFGGPDLKDERPSLPLFVHPIEGEAVKLAFEWYATGRLSDGDIAERLNSHEHTLEDGTVVHFRTKGVPGRFPPGRFGKDSVRELLQHPFYTGKVPYYGRDERGRKRKRGNPIALYDGQHPALVSDELFEEVSRLREVAGRRNRDSQGQPKVYPLSGLLACWRCRRRMRANTANGRRYYNDTTRIEHLGECDQPAVPADEIETQVVDFLRSIQLPPDWRERVDAWLHSPDELGDIQAEEAHIRARLERATELYLEGDIDKERFLEEKWACETALTNLHPPERSGIIEAGLFLEQFDLLWSQATEPIQKRKLLRLALVVAFTSGSKLVAVQPTQPFYPLMHLFWRCGSDGRLSISKTHVELVPPSLGPIL